jgi:similar to stage IV sporulation protein
VRIWHFIYGYVMIRVEGLSLERFLNLAAQAGVKVFDVKRVSYTVLYAGLSARGYRKLIKIVPERYNLTAGKRRGLPFGAMWLLHRKALLAGLIIVALGVFAAAQFVWDVQVKGISAYEGAKIEAELAEKGIKPGVYKGSLDLKSTTTQMIIAHDEIAWMNISFKGIAVVVRILPADMPPEVYDENTPCDIIAKKDAYIEKIIPLAGKAVVKQGDTVRAGDKLISGLVWDPGFPRMMFAAKGKVLASVWYKGTESAPIYNETREKTGRTQDERVVYIGKDSASLDEPCTFSEFDTETVSEYYLGDRLFLPVRVALLRHSEVVLTQTPAPLDILMVYLEERAYYSAQCLAPEDARITGHNAIFKVENDIMTATVYLQTQEDIGKVVYLEE